MQHQPLTKSAALLPELQEGLARIRRGRGFTPNVYLCDKCYKLEAYMKEHGLSALVLGMSGGVDSAVVLGILRHARVLFPGLIKRIVPMALPTFEMAIGQQDALCRADQLCLKWGIPLANGCLHMAYSALKEQVENMVGHKGSDWASGQLTSYIRTPALYYATSLLADQGLKAVVVGTTNRDEGSYLGYVGKASDGMVDIQLIADLHKSEVYQLARHLGVTQEIIDAVPSGEMYDGRVDEEVFGASYDFVELWLAHRCLDHTFDLPTLGWSPEAFSQYKTLAENLETLHAYNAHKYLVGSPAVHLNVLPSAVPGGWTQ